MIGTFWYSTVSRNTVCCYCWQERAETKPEEHIFLKSYCSSQSGPGNLCFCILKDCQDELRYTNMSVLDYERRASVQSRSSKKALPFFPPKSFSFLTLCSPFLILYTKTLNKTRPQPIKKKNPKPNKTNPPKTPYPEGRRFLSHVLAIFVAKISRQNALLMSTG